MRAAPLLLVVLALLAGCGGGDDEASGGETTTTTPSTPITECQDVEAPDPREDGTNEAPTEELDPSLTHTLTFDTSCGSFTVTLDPASAPGVSVPSPAGLSAIDLIYLLNKVISGGNVVGIDIVELAPDYDVNGMTATLAARILSECIAST